MVLGVSRRVRRREQRGENREKQRGERREKQKERREERRWINCDWRCTEHFKQGKWRIDRNQLFFNQKSFIKKLQNDPGRYQKFVNGLW